MNLCSFLAFARDVNDQLLAVYAAGENIAFSGASSVSSFIIAGHPQQSGTGY